MSVCVHDNSKNNGSIQLKLKHIVVYENSSDEFDIGHRPPSTPARPSRLRGPAPPLHKKREGQWRPYCVPTALAENGRGGGGLSPPFPFSVPRSGTTRACEKEISRLQKRRPSSPPVFGRGGERPPPPLPFSAGAVGTPLPPCF